jgi:IQ calmodulin-binding motif
MSSLPLSLLAVGGGASSLYAVVHSLAGDATRWTTKAEVSVRREYLPTHRQRHDLIASLTPLRRDGRVLKNFVGGKSCGNHSPLLLSFLGPYRWRLAPNRRRVRRATKVRLGPKEPKATKVRQGRRAQRAIRGFLARKDLRGQRETQGQPGLREPKAIRAFLARKARKVRKETKARPAHRDSKARRAKRAQTVQKERQALRALPDPKETKAKRAHRA